MKKNQIKKVVKKKRGEDCTTGFILLNFSFKRGYYGEYTGGLFLEKGNYIPEFQKGGSVNPGCLGSYWSYGVVFLTLGGVSQFIAYFTFIDSLRYPLSINSPLSGVKGGVELEFWHSPLGQRCKNTYSS